MEEIWNDIECYEDLYKVSSYGNVKSLSKQVGFYMRGEKLLKLNIDTYGYNYVILSKDGHRKIKLVHRLVAEVFIPNPNNLPQVNHIDGNKQNNKVDNLEWCTDVQNKKHGWDNKLYRRYTNHYIIQQYTLDNKLVAEYSHDIKTIAQQYSIGSQQIYKCCKGLIKTAGGYIWKYKN